ncbi:MAG: alpha/beta hydrolase [Actinobacteria bacterium]|nr:alpha/beta hydrolase [Actinomycetota bacterium]
MTQYETFDFPVRGGTAHAARWGDPKDPVVFGVHGITASHLNFALVGPELEDRACVVAPDVRGRGRSSDLPGPYDTAAYADDLVSLADHIGVERMRLAGHSMGAYISATAAALHPDRVESVLLIDGGITLPTPPDFDVDSYIKALLGPSIERLSMRFDSPEAYLDYWRVHPALKDNWSDAFEAFFRYDLVPEGDKYKTCVSADAVMEYSVDLLKTERGSDFKRMKCPTWLIRAARGVLNEETPLLPDAVVDPLIDGTDIVNLGILPDTNHWTIAFAPKGAAIIANTIEEHLLP